MTRLILIVPVFPKLSETFIVSKFLGLLDAGWDVHVVCREIAADGWQFFPNLEARPEARQRVHQTWPQNNQVTAATRWPGVLLSTLRQSPGATRRYLGQGHRRLGRRLPKDFYLDARLIELNPDIVHFEFGALAADRTHLKELLDCRLTASFRGYDINHVGLDDPGYYEDLWREADGLHFLGEDLWQRAINRGCPPDMPHALISPAIDTDVFSPPKRQTGTAVENGKTEPLRIVSVGRLHWTKGYEYGLQALEYLTQEGLPFEWKIIGDGRYLESLSFARHEMDLEGHVEFLGAQPQSSVIETLGWADVFLHPAVSEGFCNAVLEAQAAQLPVVCSDAGGLPENVVDGRTGFVVGRRNPAALASKLLALARDPELRREMGRQGRERVVNCFSLAGKTIAFDAFYRSVANNHAN